MLHTHHFQNICALICSCSFHLYTHNFGVSEPSIIPYIQLMGKKTTSFASLSSIIFYACCVHTTEIRNPREVEPATILLSYIKVQYRKALGAVRWQDCLKEIKKWNVSCKSRFRPVRSSNPGCWASAASQAWRKMLVRSLCSLSKIFCCAAASEGGETSGQDFLGKHHVCLSLHMQYLH